MYNIKCQIEKTSIWNNLFLHIITIKNILNIFFNIFTLVIVCIWLIIISEFEQVVLFLLIIALYPFMFGSIMFVLTFIPLKIELFCYEKKEILLGLFFHFIVLLLQTIVSFIFYCGTSDDLLWSNKNITLKNVVPEFFLTYFCITVPYEFMAKRDDSFASYLFANCFSVSVAIGLILSLFIPYKISSLIMLCVLLLNIPITLYVTKKSLTEL